jgi:DNA polymerase-3 subunit beta
MRVSVEAKHLASAVKKAKALVDGKPVHPMLGTFLFKTLASGHLELTAYDMATSIKIQIPAETQEDGKVCIPAKELASLVGSLSGNVSLNTTKNRVRVDCGELQVSLPLLGSADDFPAIGLPPEDGWESMDPNALAAGLDAVSYAMSRDETRYNLAGVNIDRDDMGYQCLTATDGHRLATTLVASAGIATQGSIIPAKAVQVFREALLSCPGACVPKWQITATTASIRCVGVETTTRLIDGQFPEFRQVIPDDSGSALSVERDVLIAALRRINPMSGGSGLIVMSAKDGRLSLSARSEMGEARDSLTIGEGESCTEVGLNGTYLCEALSTMPEFAVLRVGDDMSPIKVSAKDSDTVAVVMPMRK